MERNCEQLVHHFGALLRAWYERPEAGHGRFRNRVFGARAGDRWSARGVECCALEKRYTASVRDAAPSARRPISRRTASAAHAPGRLSANTDLVGHRHDWWIAAGISSGNVGLRRSRTEDCHDRHRQARPFYLADPDRAQLKLGDRRRKDTTAAPAHRTRRGYAGSH